MLNDIGAEVVTYLISTPLSAPQQVLHTIRLAVSGNFSQLPAILALDWRDEAA